VASAGCHDLIVTGLTATVLHWSTSAALH